MKRAIAIGLALGLCLAAGAGQAAEKVRVKYSLDWVITGRHAPWFTALDKGFYDEQGLSVEISRGYGAFEGLNRIISGESHFNFADTASLVLGRSRGMKVKTVAVIYGQVDAVTYYNMQTPLLERDAARVGGVNVMVFADFGLQLYSNGIAVTEDHLKRNPDMIRRFVTASVKGFRYAFEHPDEAVELLVKRHPIVNRALAKAEVEIVKDLVLSEEARQHGIGYISPERMQITRDIIAQAYNVKTEIPLEDLYTNEFLPR
ncbi:MAG: ABC transporter substrate-binding protein [Deltaproteobacteria bacterium]|nr:ABC transporter substrate-binding protein [Deltaproteobacteria bacterium]